MVVGFRNQKEPVVQSQRGLNLDHFDHIFGHQGSHCLLQVAVPEGIGIPTDDQRESGQRCTRYWV